MKKSKVVITLWLMCAVLLTGCGDRTDNSGGPDVTKETGAAASGSEQAEEAAVSGSERAEEAAVAEPEQAEETAAPPEKEADKPGSGIGSEENGQTAAGKSLAQRMAGKYSYHYRDEEGNDEFYIMDVVPFGDNLYAYCGQAMPEDDESLEAYSFWASEFIPYDADEMTAKEGDTVTVNELRFSIMSNVGKYWDAGHKGTITLTDDGLVLAGFEREGFLVPDHDDSRLFLKDDRVEDAFGYLRDGKGDEALDGLWMLDHNGVRLYLEFSGANLYLYRKDPGSEVVYAAGACDFSDGTFSCTASCLGCGGMPHMLTCDYEVSGDRLTLKTTGSDLPDEMPANGKYQRVREGKIPVMTMEEVQFDSESFGFFGGDQNLDVLRSQDYYGVFVSSSKSPDGCTQAISKLEEAGFPGSLTVYTPDFSGLNPEPYYVATTGLYTSERVAREALSKVKTAGFSDAYVKYAGSYTGDRYRYTMYDGGNIDLLRDCVMLRGVSLTIPYLTDGEPVTADLLVTEEAVFDGSADPESFGNYEKGDTPYEWIVRNRHLMEEDPDKYLMHGPALSGVFEVGVKDNRITTYYGSYWWD